MQLSLNSQSDKNIFSLLTIVMTVEVNVVSKGRAAFDS